MFARRFSSSLCPLSILLGVGYLRSLGGEMVTDSCITLINVSAFTVCFSSHFSTQYLFCHFIALGEHLSNAITML